MQISFAPENQNSRNRIFPFNEKSPQDKTEKDVDKNKACSKNRKVLEACYSIALPLNPSITTESLTHGAHAKAIAALQIVTPVFV